MHILSPGQAVTAGEFKACLKALGWSRRQAARILLGDEEEVAYIHRWAGGRTRVAPWIERHLRSYLGLAPTDQLPTGRIDWSPRLPDLDP